MSWPALPSWRDSQQGGPRGSSDVEEGRFDWNIFLKNLTLCTQAWWCLIFCFSFKSFQYLLLRVSIRKCIKHNWSFKESLILFWKMNCHAIRELHTHTHTHVSEWRGSSAAVWSEPQGERQKRRIALRDNVLLSVYPGHLVETGDRISSYLLNCFPLPPTHYALSNTVKHLSSV